MKEIGTDGHGKLIMSLFGKNPILWSTHEEK